MESLPADRYAYPARETVDQSLHGHALLTPARLVGYGTCWEGDECILWAEGEVVQAAMFGEDLHLFRRTEARMGGNGFTVEDRAENHGFSRTPHMLLYHVNLGYPLLDEGSEFRAPVERMTWRSHEAYRNGVGYRTMPPPADFVEQVPYPRGGGRDRGHGSGRARQPSARCRRRRPRARVPHQVRPVQP